MVFNNKQQTGFEPNIWENGAFFLSNIPQTHLDSSKKKGAYAHEQFEKIDFYNFGKTISGKLLRLTFGAF